MVTDLRTGQSGICDHAIFDYMTYVSGNQAKMEQALRSLRPFSRGAACQSEDGPAVSLNFNRGADFLQMLPEAEGWIFTALFQVFIEF